MESLPRRMGSHAPKRMPAAGKAGGEVKRIPALLKSRTDRFSSDGRCIFFFPVIQAVMERKRDSGDRNGSVYIIFVENSVENV